MSVLFLTTHLQHRLKTEEQFRSCCLHWLLVQAQKRFNDFAHTKDCFERIQHIGVAHLIGQLGFPVSRTDPTPPLSTTLAFLESPQPAYVYTLKLLNEISQVSVPELEAIGHTLQHSDESDYEDKIPLVMAEFGKLEQLSHHDSATELDGFQMWSAPTSYVRGIEEGEETVAGPSASSSINNSTDSLMVIDVPTSQGRPQCTRCSKVKSNTMCEPKPSSKKCAKCYQDHRVSFTSPPKRTAPVSTGGNVTSGSEISDFEEELDELEKDEKLSSHRKGTSSPSKNGYPGQINGKKCRRDKQSCSFAPYGGRRKPVSKVMAEEDDEDGTDGDSEQEAKPKGRFQKARATKGKEKEKPTVVERAMEKASVNGDERPKEKNVTNHKRKGRKGK
ncbi:hypothetical protein F5887DRAFT_1091939 [Amanita rubescens]|nr:hypothetical protein F5887DRAFT_1091939 [Amanita rubescens]